MKRNSILKSNFCYSILILILLLSCSNSDDNVNLSGEFIIADVETLSFQSSSVPNGVTAQIIGNTYVVQGFDSAANAIVLLINDFDGTGTYDISFSEDNNGTSGLFSNQSTAWSSVGGEGGNGTITVLVNNEEETSGSFEFIGIEANDASSTKTVTNGSFRVKY